MVRAALRVIGLVALLSVACDGAPLVSLKSRSGYVGSAPVKFKFQSTVEYHVNNRVFCLEWASEHASGQSCQELTTLRALTIWRDVIFRRGGEYNVIAWVGQNDEKKILSNIETIRILDALGQ